MRAEYFLASLKSVALLTGFAKYCRAVSRKSQLPFASKICGGASASSYAHYRELAPLRRSFLAYTHFSREDACGRFEAPMFVRAVWLDRCKGKPAWRASRQINRQCHARETQKLKVESAFASGNREMGFTR
jgi:hypothetical protein